MLKEWVCTPSSSKLRLQNRAWKELPRQRHPGKRFADWLDVTETWSAKEVGGTSCIWQPLLDEDALGAAFAVVENAIKSVAALGDLTEAHAGKCGGKLVLKGTRFSIAQLIAELADDLESVRNVCDNYDLDPEQVVAVLHALASGIGSPAKTWRTSS
jgi:uncharacterized protein (DUF433 family)